MTHPAPEGTVFIVDDDFAVRDSLTMLLGWRGYATRAFATGEEFLAALAVGTHGCVLLDLRMPGMDGLAVQRELARRAIEMPVIFLTAHGDAATARAALKAGAFDFLEKPFDDAVLRKTVEDALDRDRAVRVQADHLAQFDAKLARLTPREREVLDLVVRGRHAREIAALLGISPRTVEVYKARFMDKLQIDRLPDLIRMVLERELAERPEPR